MKLFSLILTSIMLLVASQSVGQATKRKKIQAAPVVNEITNTPLLRSAPTAIDSLELDEATFLKILTTDRWINEFDDMKYTNTSSYTSFKDSSGIYSYTFSTPVDFYELNSAISTWDGSPITITKTDTVKAMVRAFGGQFFNIDINDTFVSDSIKITVGTYSFKFLASSTTAFVGFIFSDTITSVSVASTNATRYPAINRIYWSAVKPVTTALREASGDDVVLYPNPTSDGVTINAEGTISIYSLTGQLVVKQAITKNAYISLSGLPKGDYVVSVQSSNGYLQKKLIKK